MPATIVPEGSRKSSDPRDPRTPALADVSLDDLEIVGRHASVKPGKQLLGGEIVRTIEGASSLTTQVHDPTLALLNGPVLKGNGKGDLHAETVADGQVFAYTGIGLEDNHLLEVIFEDDAIRALRQFKTALTMSRNSVTRAQFIKRMCDEAGVDFYCPELDQKQPIEKASERETRAQKDRKRKPGFADHAILKVKGEVADSEQRDILERALDSAASHNAPDLACIALVLALIVESECKNQRPAGVLQFEAATAAGAGFDPMDVEASVTHVLTGRGATGLGNLVSLAQQNPSWPAYRITQTEQGSGAGKATDGAANYGPYETEAKEIVEAYSGGVPISQDASITIPKSYQFKRENGEDSWTCAKRLAGEVNWFLFAVSGTVYFISGPKLLASRPQILVAPRADGVYKVRFKYMSSPLHDDTITVECSARAWGAPPGTVAEVEGYGPVDGKWAVGTIKRPKVRSQSTTVTLIREPKPKLEPAHETQTLSPSSQPEAGPGTALAVYEAAVSLDALKIPYPPGDRGDTGHAPGEIGKTRPAFLDCSATTAYALHRGGMFDSSTAIVSGAFASEWGEPGEGKYMTVWANGVHVWIEFKIPGKPRARLDTVPGVGEENGPRLRTSFPAPEGTASFTPRHWPGQ